jgi:hypothetical protein
MVQNKLQKNGTQIFADEMTLILKISVYLRSIHYYVTATHLGPLQKSG